MPAPEKMDWDQAFDEYLLVHKPKGMKQYEFAAMKEVNSAHLSVRFSEIENERLMVTNKSRFPKLLQKSLDTLNEALDEAPDRSIAELRSGISVTDKAKLSLATATAMADRLGMSPQAMTINMQQLNQKNTVTLAMPIFAQSASNAIERFLGAKTIDVE